MTDYAANFTHRIRLQYQTQGRQHKMLWRINNVTEGALISGANELGNFLNALAALRYTDWTVLGWEWSEQGNDFFVPFAPGTVIDAGTQNFDPPTDANVFLGFQGISSLGNRASLFVYGVKFTPATGVGNSAQDYRILASENGTIVAALSELNTAVLNVAIDNTNIIWKNYANVGYNAYWQRKSRQG